jgi:hypothetical protein
LHQGTPATVAEPAKLFLMASISEMKTIYVRFYSKTWSAKDIIFLVGMFTSRSLGSYDPIIQPKLCV